MDKKIICKNKKIVVRFLNRNLYWMCLNGWFIIASGYISPLLISFKWAPIRHKNRRLPKIFFFHFYYSMVSFLNVFDTNQFIRVVNVIFHCIIAVFFFSLFLNILVWCNQKYLWCLRCLLRFLYWDFLSFCCFFLNHRS